MPNPSSIGPAGRSSGRVTVGLRRRRAVRPAYAVRLGKLANKLEEVELGLEHDPAGARAEYPVPRRNPFRILVLPVLRRIPSSSFAVASALAERSLTALRDGLGSPRPDHCEALVCTRATFARDHLYPRGLKPLAGDLAARTACIAGRPPSHNPRRDDPDETKIATQVPSRRTVTNSAALGADTDSCLFARFRDEVERRVLADRWRWAQCSGTRRWPRRVTLIPRAPEAGTRPRSPGRGGRSGGERGGRASAPGRPCRCRACRPRAPGQPCRRRRRATRWPT